MAPSSSARPAKGAIERIFLSLQDFFQGWNSLPPLKLALVFLAGLTMICGAAAIAGAVPTHFYGHDIFVLLDSGWRVINGQRPHVDFYSPFGPLTFLISGLGLRIANFSVDGVGYGTAIFACIVGLWGFLLARPRLTPIFATVFGFFLAALAAAPYALGTIPNQTSHAMAYNRYGFSLLALIFLEAMEPPRRKNDLWGGLSTGVALGLTLFLKASYFIMGTALIFALALLFNRFTRTRIAGITLAFAAVVTCFLAYLRFDVMAVLGDLRMAAGARAVLLSPMVAIKNAVNHVAVLIGVLLLCLIAAPLLPEDKSRWHGLRLPLFGIFMFFVDIGVMFGNQQHGGFPLTAAFAVLIMSELVSAPGPPISFPSHTVAAICLGAVMFLPQFTSDLAGLVYGAWQKERPAYQQYQVLFTSPRLKSLLLYDGHDDRQSNGAAFTTYVNEGVALLERETRPQETILTMDQANPFPYALGRRPPRGGMSTMAYQYTITDRFRPSDDKYFGDADIVMYPKHPSQTMDGRFLYKPGLEQRFRLAAENDWWLLYRRK
jgi:hypothetical protein